MEGNLVCLKKLIQAGAWNSAKLQWPEDDGGITEDDIKKLIPNLKEQPVKLSFPSVLVTGQYIWQVEFSCSGSCMITRFWLFQCFTMVTLYTYYFWHQYWWKFQISADAGVTPLMEAAKEGNLVCLKELIQAGAWNSAKLQWPELWCFWPIWKDQGNVEISVMNTNLETLNLGLETGPRNGFERYIRLALQSARRRFKIDNTVLKKRLVHTDYPMITCFSIKGLLNSMLSPQQNTFWHQEQDKEKNCGFLWKEDQLQWSKLGGVQLSSNPIHLSFVWKT